MTTQLGKEMARSRDRACAALPNKIRKSPRSQMSEIDVFALYIDLFSKTIQCFEITIGR